MLIELNNDEYFKYSPDVKKILENIIIKTKGNFIFSLTEVILLEKILENITNVNISNIESIIKTLHKQLQEND